LYFYFLHKFLISNLDQLIKNIFSKYNKRGDNILPDFEDNVLKLLRKIDEKLDKLLDVNSSKTESTKTATPPEDEYVKPSSVVENQEEKEKAKERPPIEGRRICPACGGTSFNTEEDKSQVLFQQAGIKIHPKKYICRNCGTEA